MYKKAALAYTSTAMLMLTATVAVSQQVVLKSPDGSINMGGELLSSEGDVYVLRTSVGDMFVSKNTVACEGAACPPQGDVGTADFKIIGSSTVGSDLMPLLIAGFSEARGAALQQMQGTEEKQTTYVALGEFGSGEEIFSGDITLRGSSGGFKALVSGEADIAMASRPVRAKEVKAAADAGLGQLDSFEQEHSIGADGLLLVVNTANAIDALTESEVAAVLSGRLTNWSQLGGADLPITVYSRRLESSNHGTIEDRFLTPRGFDLSPGAITLSSNQVMADTILSDPGGIGYLAFAYSQDTKPLGLISACGITARPDGFSVKTGEYPLQRTLFLYSPSRGLSETARDLIDFATSKAADPLVRKSGFLDYSVSSRGLEGTANTLRPAINATNSPSERDLMQDMFTELSGRDRLSTTFRFRTGSSVLDNASQRDLRRLADYLSDLPENAEIVFAGFTDADGSFEANRTLSIRRADEVRATLSRLVGNDVIAGKRVSVKGFGELNPVGCNDDFQGKRLNRRVEIWVSRAG